jgi:GPH family glycoside/pentoside/hexuronide:cation symporter
MSKFKKLFGINGFFRYGIGMFGTSLAINMFRARATSFYFDQGLKLELTGIILILYTTLDIIDNPIYGILSDNTRSKWGRRKPWLLIAAPLFAVCFILFFAPPVGAGESVLFVWALVFYFITGTLDSMLNANYGALFPEIFPDEKERAKANAVRQSCQLVAMILGMGLVPIIAGAIGYLPTALIYGIISAAVIVYMALGMKEPKPKSEQKVNFIKAVLSIIKSKNFWMVGIANAFYSGAMALVMTAVPFFVKYSLNKGALEETIILGTVILIALGGVIVWNYFIKKTGNVKLMWRIALIVLGVAFLPLYFAKSLWFAIVSAAFVGLGFAGVISTMDLMGAKVLDEDYAKNRVRREGIFSSTMGFLNRLSNLIVAAGLLIVSSLYGFKNADFVGDNPDAAARFLLTLFPMVLTAIGVLFTFFVHFTHKSRSEVEAEEDAKLAEETEGLGNADFNVMTPGEKDIALDNAEIKGEDFTDRSDDGA